MLQLITSKDVLTLTISYTLCRNLLSNPDRSPLLRIQWYGKISEKVLCKHTKDRACKSLTGMCHRFYSVILELLELHIFENSTAIEVGGLG